MVPDHSASCREGKNKNLQYRLLGFYFCHLLLLAAGMYYEMVLEQHYAYRLKLFAIFNIYNIQSLNLL